MLDFFLCLLHRITPQEYELRRVKKKIDKEIFKNFNLWVRIKIKYGETLNDPTLGKYQIELDYKKRIFPSSKEWYIISFY